MTTIQDRFWLWGQDMGCHHGLPWWNIPGVNKLDPVAGAAYLGIPNCCRVVFHNSPLPPFDDESRKMAGFKNVVWSIIGDGGSKRNDDGNTDVDEVLRQAQMFPNVVGGIFDDFFLSDKEGARLTPEGMAEVARKLHTAPRPLKLWLVYYAALFKFNLQRWLDLADVVTFWSWNSVELANAEANLNRIISMTPTKEHYAGCYLFNYGDNRLITPEEMTFQLDLYHRFMREGKIQGVIVCSNTVADCCTESVDIFRKWMDKHGSEIID